MLSDSTQLFLIFGGVFICLIFGKWRYDLVAFSALILAWSLGLVSEMEALSGFGHPATITVALVLIVSAGLSNAGVVGMLGNFLMKLNMGISGQVSIFGIIGGALSAVMNNVAALALLMPVNKEVSKKSNHSVKKTLMPLSFATILGGMMTLIGTPPNIIIANYRNEQFGESFQMFDFLPVGSCCAIAGILYISTLGWRLLPKEKSTVQDEEWKAEDFIIEMLVSSGSDVIGKRIKELYKVGESSDTDLIGLVRNGRRLPGFSTNEVIRENDILLVEGQASEVNRLKGKLGIEFLGEKLDKKLLVGDLKLLEVVVPKETRMEGKSALELRLKAKKGITLLGISRQGKRFRSRVRHEKIKAGDLLLLLGQTDDIYETLPSLGVLPLAERGLRVIQHKFALLALLVFSIPIIFVSIGTLNLVLALSVICLIYIAVGLVPAKKIYSEIEWPIIVLVASMIPLGTALENSGGTRMIAEAALSYSAGFETWVILLGLMIVIMTLSDVLNNTATAVVGAPIAVHLAESLNVSPDGFLMGVAVAASCAFLTPIGHKNNTLILGPGGYRFSDYWKIGLPLEIIVLGVSVPLIMFTFPF